VHPVIGPDATGVGWVYEYALVDKSGRNAPKSKLHLQSHRHQGNCFVVELVVVRLQGVVDLKR